MAYKCLLMSLPITMAFSQTIMVDCSGTDKSGMLHTEQIKLIGADHVPTAARELVPIYSSIAAQFDQGGFIDCAVPAELNNMETSLRQNGIVASPVSPYQKALHESRETSDTLESDILLDNGSNEKDQNTISTATPGSSPVLNALVLPSSITSIPSLTISFNKRLPPPSGYKTVDKPAMMTSAMSPAQSSAEWSLVSILSAGAKAESSIAAHISSTLVHNSASQMASNSTIWLSFGSLSAAIASLLLAIYL